MATATGAELATQLERQLTALNALHEALASEAEALRAADTQLLDDATHAKTERIEQVQAEEQALTEQLQQLGYHSDQQELTRWLQQRFDHAHQLLDLLARLRSAASACAELNQRNGAVIEGTRRYVADALEVMTGASATPAGTYDASGAHSNAATHHIGTA